MKPSSPGGTGSTLDWLMGVFGAATALFLRLTEAGLALIGFIVVVYLLLGEDSGAFVIAVVANVVTLVGALTPQALIGVSIVLALVYLIRRTPR